MAQAFLINTVRGSFGTMLAGTELDDQSAVANDVTAAGGQLILATNVTVSTAAARVLRLRRRGGSDDEANQIMNSALDAAQEGAELASFANGIDVQTTLTHTGTLGLHGAPAVAQGADFGALTDNVGGADNNTLDAIPDPGDAPATADALRDDLVANTLPEIRDAISTLTARINDLRDLLSEAAGGNGTAA